LTSPAAPSRRDGRSSSTCPKAIDVPSGIAGLASGDQGAHDPPVVKIDHRDSDGVRVQAPEVLLRPCPRQGGHPGHMRHDVLGHRWELALLPVLITHDEVLVTAGCCERHMKRKVTARWTAGRKPGAGTTARTARPWILAATHGVERGCGQVLVTEDGAGRDTPPTGHAMARTRADTGSAVRCWSGLPVIERSANRSRLSEAQGCSAGPRRRDHRPTVRPCPPWPGVHRTPGEHASRDFVIAVVDE